MTKISIPKIDVPTFKIKFNLCLISINVFDELLLLIDILTTVENEILRINYNFPLD